MPKEIRTPELERLLDALGVLKNNDERYRLLLDLATRREIEDMSQRFHVAELLKAGNSYAVIQEQTGASSTTVARVSTCLNHGDGGYEIALERLENLEEI